MVDCMVPEHICMNDIGSHVSNESIQSQKLCDMTSFGSLPAVVRRLIGIYFFFDGECPSLKTKLRIHEAI